MTPDWRVFRPTDEICERHETVWFPLTNNIAFTWWPDWSCATCRARAESMVHWAMEPILAAGRVAVAVVERAEDDYRKGGEERWHRRIGWRVHHGSCGPDPRAVVIVAPARTFFFATEELGGKRAEPRDDQWWDLSADETAHLLAGTLAGDLVRVEAFYMRGFGNWIAEISLDRWAVLMAVEGLQINRQGYSIIKGIASTQPEWLLGR